MTPLRQLANFVAETRFDDIPVDVVERAKQVLCDTIGVIIGGMREPEHQALAEYAAKRHRGDAWLFGHGRCVQPEWAALIHGTAGTALEMDEGHAYARGHAAIHAATPALALAHGMQGKDLLTTFVIGYEVAARVGIATRLRPAVHPFGAWGVLGAAAVGACHQNIYPENGQSLDAKPRAMTGQEVAELFELTASYAITPSFESAFQGANVRNTYAGTVNQLGMRAAELYALGFRGESGGVQTTFGGILGETFEEAALTDGLGYRYEIMRGYFKPYSGCRYTHGAIDAILQMRDEATIDTAAISAIQIDVYEIAARLAEPEPQTPLAGRFSLPHVVAACLVLGHAGPDAFSVHALNQPDIRALAGKVTVTEDPAFTALTPAQRPARVTITLDDGSQPSKTVMSSKGDPDQPMSEVELREKYISLVEPSFGPKRADESYALLGKLEELATLGPLWDLLT